MAWGRPTRQTVVTPPLEDEYSRPGGGLFGIEGDPVVEGYREGAGPTSGPERGIEGETPIEGYRPGAGPTDQYTNGQSYPEGYQPPAGDTGFPLDPSTATPMPMPDPYMVSDPRWAMQDGGVSPNDLMVSDPRWAFGKPPLRNTGKQMVAGVPTSMANFRPRLPGQARTRGLDRRAALLRALGLR